MFQRGRIFCTECPPIFNRRQQQIGPALTLIEDNYSGCGVDMAYCEEGCGKGFCISYKVDKVERAPDWDVDLEAEKRAEEAYRLKRAEQLETEAARLRCKTS